MSNDPTQYRSRYDLTIGEVCEIREKLTKRGHRIHILMSLSIIYNISLETIDLIRRNRIKCPK